MKTKYIYPVAVSLCVLLLGACKKDFLNTKPTDLLSKDAIFSDSTVTETYVLGRYIGVSLTWEEGKPSFQRGFERPFLSSLSDESIATQNFDSYLFQQGIQTPDNEGFMGNFWTRGYRSIREINYGLANIDAVPMSAATKARLKAELHFIRGYRYHDLIRTYGGVPLVGDKVWGLDDKDFDPLYVRSSIQDCIAYAVNELDQAATGLANVNLPEGRASQGAALALKARLLLYAASPLYNDGKNDQAKWAAAAAAAKVVIDLKRYSLFGNYRNEFLTNHTSEDIFERLYTPTNVHTALELVTGPNGYGGWGGDTPLQNFVDAFEMKNGKAISDPTSGYDPQNPYANRDPRLTDVVLYNGHPYRGRPVQTFLPGGADSKDGIQNWNTTLTGYYLLKFMNESINASDPNNLYLDQTQTQPFKYIRYAEILLNYAEAQNESVGPDNSVYSAINPIRERSGMPDLPSGLSQSDMRERIIRERQVELCFEEHRFYDVRRWKIADVVNNVPAYGISPVKQSNGTIVYTKSVSLTGRKFSDKDYWMPIPQSEILASGGKLKQNPGYNN
jgi:hypothetical protein